MTGWEPSVNDATIINLEGALCLQRAANIDQATHKRKHYRLYNSPHIIQVLRQWGVRVAALANNHILDCTVSPSATRLALSNAGIAACGAGDDIAEAAAPALLSIGELLVAFVAFGWEPIECVSAGPTSSGVNPLRPLYAIDTIRHLCKRSEVTHIVALMHWNFNLERYPMPAHRQLAMDMIDAGATIVVGHHPHCAHGVEFHNGKPIVYSLGNWFLPVGSFFGRPLTFPDYAKRQLAFRFRPGTGEAKCLWYEHDYDTLATHLVQEEDARDGDTVRALTPFAGLSHEEYARWFETHRVKRTLLPIYRDYRHILRNSLRDRWVALRSHGLKVLRP